MPWLDGGQVVPVQAGERGVAVGRGKGGRLRRAGSGAGRRMTHEVWRAVTSSSSIDHRVGAGAYAWNPSLDAAPAYGCGGCHPQNGALPTMLASMLTSMTGGEENTCLTLSSQRSSTTFAP